MTQFDKFSENYSQEINRSLRKFGGSLDYYTQYKAWYIKRIVGDDYSGKVLDFGCGIGLLSEALYRMMPGINLTGFDISEGSISRIDQPGDSKISFTSKAEDLGSDFELVVVSNVFHHIPIDRRGLAMEEIAGYLGRGGRIIVFEHNPLNVITRIVVNRCSFDVDAVLLSPKELKRYLHQVGLSKLRKDYIVFFPSFLALFRRLEPYLRLLPLGAQYVIVGQKHERS